MPATDSPLKFGQFKWGEPLQFYHLNSLLNYLPKFVVQNDLCKDILTAIAIQILKWYDELKSLTSYKITGRAGLKFANEDLQLFVSSKKTSDEVKGYIGDYFGIHQKRGTIDGLPDDVRRVSGDEGAYVIYHPPADCGWWGDVTFPEYNVIDKFSYDSNVYIDMPFIIDIVLKNKSDYTDAELQKIIREEFCPVTKPIRFLFLKPHTIEWGEPLAVNNPTQIKFGTFKFGEPVNE